MAKPSASVQTAEPAQVSPAGLISVKGERAAEDPRKQPLPDTESANTIQSQFRVERIPVVSGAELLTIFGRLDGMRTAGLPAPEIPLLSVVRDTLSDDNPENGRLRYVWM